MDVDVCDRIRDSSAAISQVPLRLKDKDLDTSGYVRSDLPGHPTLAAALAAPRP